MLRKARGMYSEIPFPKVENRPLIVSHPGAYHNYLASWNVMVDNQQPFVLVCDELSPTYPDDLGWGMFSQDGREYFARVDNPIGIGQSYRNPDLSFQNLVIHRHKCAKSGMDDFPFIDVMYTDFPELFTTYTEDRKHPLLKAAPLLSSKVRDGGLIIFDKKNVHDGVKAPTGIIEIEPGLKWEHLGSAEWFVIPGGVNLHLAPNQGIQGEVYRVSHDKTFPDCFDFLARLMKHRRMSVEELKEVVETPPKRWPFHISVSQYYSSWNRHQEFGSGGFEHPVPLYTPWNDEMFAQWIEWLIEHPEQLRPIERKERYLKIGDVNVTLVHGDITDHLDWLESKNASLVLRRKLLIKCLEINPFLRKNTVNLQPKWDNPPIPKLKWSCNESHQDLTRSIMQLSKTKTMATISHGDGSLQSLVEALKGVNYPIRKSVIIFHIDEDDYKDLSNIN